MCIVSAAMLKIEMPDPYAVSEPAPQFATEAEVAFAQWLRQQLEQRYLGRSGASELKAAAHLREVH